MLKFCSLTRRKSKAGDYNDLLKGRSSLDNDSIKDLIKQRKPIILALSSNVTKASLEDLFDNSKQQNINSRDKELKIVEPGKKVKRILLLQNCVAHLKQDLVYSGLF